MFTGLWPRSHGANAFRGEQDLPINVYPLAREHVTLAEIAREHGYRTAGFSSNNVYMSSRWGMDQGFQEYLCRPAAAGGPCSSARLASSPGGGTGGVPCTTRCPTSRPRR